MNSGGSAKRRHMRQRMVDVAGLGVAVVGPRQVAAAEPLGEILQPGAAAVVQHPDAKIRIVRSRRADDGALEDRLLLVVGADEHVDERRGLVSASQALLASTSEERSRVRLRKTSDSAPAASQDVSATKKISAEREVEASVLLRVACSWRAR